MKLWDSIKKFNSINLATIMLPGYIFKKWIFRIGIGTIFLWLLVAGASFGFKWENTVYVHCVLKGHFCENINIPCAEVCDNPFYDPLGRNVVCSKYGICDQEFLRPGETYGSPPSFWVNHAGEFAGLVVFLMVSLNHLFFNKGFFKEPLDRIKKEGL